MALKALIFDCDGTLAETEEAHRAAFNAAFAEAGLGWHWSGHEYHDLLKVTGGKERIAHHVVQEHLPNVDIPVLHKAKNAIYARLVKTGQVELRPGILRLMEEAQAAGLAIAIATTTTRSNLDSLIAATALCSIDFEAIVTGEDVQKKKPDPEVYQIVLQRLSISAGEVIAFEDSRNGLMAATLCGIETIITPSFYTQDEDFTGAMLVLPDLDQHSGPSLLDAISQARMSQART